MKKFHEKAKANEGCKYSVKALEKAEQLWGTNPRRHSKGQKTHYEQSEKEANKNTKTNQEKDDLSLIFASHQSNTLYSQKANLRMFPK